MLEAVRQWLSPETVLRSNEPLAKRTTLGVGGRARWYAEPASVEDLISLKHAAAETGLPVFFLGRGSNLLVMGGGIEVLVIRLQHRRWRQVDMLSDGCLRAGAGVRLRELCGEALRRGLAGLEFLEGIPGTVGGALRMNAGAMGGWMLEVVESVRLVNGQGGETVCRREDLHYGYRHCRELRDACALEAVLRPPGRAASEAIREVLHRHQEHRQATQPREPSAGCIFKNPDGDSAGRLIDHCGLKGTRVGDAEVSPVHGNFIINRGRATSGEVVDLVRRVRDGVWKHARVELEPEVLLLGAEWEDLL